jgi:hypothetical protein
MQYRVSPFLHRNWPILPQVSQIPVPVRTGKRWRGGQEDSMNNITGIQSLSPLVGVKIVHLVERSDLFKISNLVCDGREIVRSLYNSL